MNNWRCPMKKLKNLIILILIFSLFPFSAYAEIIRNETVYVNLDHEGRPVNITVVNHLSGTSEEDYYIDYGHYENIKSLVENIEPVIEGNQIKWPTALLKEKDIYYEGTLTKDLPINIDIRYFLDGKEVKGQELVGQTGKMALKILIQNPKGKEENQPPLTTQIQIPLHLDVFSNIHTDDGVTSVIGKTMTVVFNHFSFGEQEFEVEADGKNIELDPILISSTSAKISFPNELEKDLQGLSSGINQMTDAGEKLQKGSTQLLHGNQLLQEGIEALNAGIGKLFSGITTLLSKSKILSKGFEEFNTGLKQLKDHSIQFIDTIHVLGIGINQIVGKSDAIQEGFDGLNHGLKEVNKGVYGVNKGLEEINHQHESLMTLAKSLSQNDDPKVRALAQGVLQEGTALATLTQISQQSSTGLNTIVQNTQDLSTGYQQYHKGLENFAQGINQLNEQIKPLPEEVNKMYQAHARLTSGLHDFFEGLNSVNNGFLTMNDQINILPNEITKLTKGQEEITTGIKDLNEKGIKKVKKASSLFSNLIGAQNKSSEEKYTSFVDNKNNKNSSCQFVMKTPAIRLQEQKENTSVDSKTKQEKKTFLDRLLDLFKK